METYKADFSQADIGEIIQIIRIKRFKQNVAGFARHFGLSERSLELIEDGKSNAGLGLLKSIQKKYPKFLQLKLEVTILQ